MSAIIGRQGGSVKRRRDRREPRPFTGRVLGLRVGDLVQSAVRVARGPRPWAFSSCSSVAQAIFVPGACARMTAATPRRTGLRTWRRPHLEDQLPARAKNLAEIWKRLIESGKVAAPLAGAFKLGQDLTTAFCYRGR